jgi:predicted permease
MIPRPSTILNTVSRPSRVIPWLEGLWQDVRHSARVFLKNPGFTAIAVVSIAFGTGANVAVFSLADALLLRPLPVLRPSEVLTVGTRVQRGVVTMTVTSVPDYVDIRDRTRSFDGLIGFAYENAAFTVHPNTPPQVKLLTLASANFFRVLGVEPELGRGFTDEEARVTGRAAVTVLSYGTWQQQFAGDPNILGQKIRISGLDFTIIGVAPERFTGLHPFAREGAFVPLAIWPKVVFDRRIDPLTTRDFRYLTLKARLRPGVTMAEAQAELTLLGNDLEHAYPQTNTNQGLLIATELEDRFERRPLDSRMIVILTTLSIAVLCVACANVAGLLASRGPVRAREIALRLAVGGSRVRLVRQLITESLAIAIAGGAAGLGVGYAGIVMLRRIQLPTDVIAGPQIQLDQRALTFSLLAAIASAFLFGLGPALQTTRVNLVTALKGSEAGGVRSRLLGRHTLVVIQVALSLVLLTVSSFSSQVFDRALSEGPGFRTTQLAKITIDPGQARYDQTGRAQFVDRALEQIRLLPGAGRATATSAMPMFSFASAWIAPEGQELPQGQPGFRVNVNSVDEDYFSTMEIPLLAGRAFRSTDTADTPFVAIVNDVFARHYWPGRDPLGRRFRVPTGASDPGPWVEVVGLAKVSSYHYPAEVPADMVYLPYRQQPTSAMVLLAQTTGESSSMIAPMRDVVRKMDADVPVFDGQTMESFYAARATTIGNVLIGLVSGMGIMGMTLTMVGLYGLVSYSVSRRTREIGIRMAIGATHARVLLMVLTQGLVPAWIGLGAGLVLSVVTMRILPGVMMISARNDPKSFFLVVPMLLVVALIASLVPARRAAKVNPTIALRYD